GFRSILFYKKGGMAVFLHLYAKSMRANVSASEQQVLEKLAKELKKLTPAQIKDLTATGRWEEVLDD
ncbi:type II toxin-antitoxin system RelE/ParE family toxin, partial [Klebsiella pneumoniae]|nr:type II toxin-antitoxin system RelE/ParE family toxin [Klebsiella pneumoniae]